MTANLVAHTPRAGSHGFRSLVPPGCPLDILTIRKVLSEAMDFHRRGIFVGSDYVLAFREVAQQDTSRPALEGLVLYPLRSPKESMQKELESLLPDLDALMSDPDYDWDRLGDDDPIFVDRLKDMTEKLSPAVSQSNRVRIGWSIVIASVFVSIASFTFFTNNEPTPETQPSGKRSTLAQVATSLGVKPTGGREKQIEAVLGRLKKLGLTTTQETGEAGLKEALRALAAHVAGGEVFEPGKSIDQYLTAEIAAINKACLSDVIRKSVSDKQSVRPFGWLSLLQKDAARKRKSDFRALGFQLKNKKDLVRFRSLIQKAVKLRQRKSNLGVVDPESEDAFQTMKRFADLMIRAKSAPATPSKISIVGDADAAAAAWMKARMAEAGITQVWLKKSQESLSKLKLEHAWEKDVYGLIQELPLVTDTE